ncbi:MAG: hypothetical protein WBO23_10735 [Burkholderiales bacterium]
MKKPATFTLVRKFDFGTPVRSRARTGAFPSTGSYAKPKIGSVGDSILNYAQAEQVVLKSVKASPKLTKVFVNLDPQFKKALISSFVTIPAKAAKSRARAKPSVSTGVISVARELARLEKVRRVGVLDMGAWIGGLPTLIERLNAAQPLFTIFEVQAPIPGGLLKTPAGMAEWAVEHLGKQLSKRERDALERHVIANEFFAAAEDIRTHLGLDFIVGMTPAMVAGVQSDGSIYWNHFSSVFDKTILLSTADLRQFAEDAGRPFEAGVGALLVAALQIAVNRKLGYHEDTGCIFDYNGMRATLVTTFKQMRIDAQCLHNMTPEQRDAATSMLAVLKRMKRRAT